MKITTVKAGKDYRVTTDSGARLRLCRNDDQDTVTVYTATSNLGGYRLERFGGELSPTGIRTFFDTVKI